MNSFVLNEQVEKEPKIHSFVQAEVRLKEKSSSFALSNHRKLKHLKSFNGEPQPQSNERLARERQVRGSRIPYQ